MHYANRSIATVIAGIMALGPGLRTISAQVSIDRENRYPSVGAIMVWLVDDAGKPVQLRGFASGTLIRDRVMLTAGHFTAPAKALGSLPPSIRMFASFSPTDAKDPRTWIPVVRQATHPSMPHCPPPPQCDPTDDILVAPLQPGIADVGLVFLEHAPPGIKPARLASHGTLHEIRGSADDHRGIRHHDAENPDGTAGPFGMGRETAHQDFDATESRRRDLGALVHTQLCLLRRLRWGNLSESLSRPESQ